MSWLQRLIGGKPTREDSVQAWLMKPERVDAGVPTVGEQSYQSAINRIAGPKTPDGPTNPQQVAILVAEPKNRYDPNAISVRIDGQVVGYLDREHAVWYGPLVRWALGQQRFIAADAWVTGGWNRGRGDEGSYGLELHLGTPAECILEILGDEITLRSDHRWAGQMVCFTGENRYAIHGMRLDREGSEMLARKAGMVTHPRLTKKVQVLVDCDPDIDTAKDRKAGEYGALVVDELTFWKELGLTVEEVDWRAQPGVRQPSWASRVGR